MFFLQKDQVIVLSFEKNKIIYLVNIKICLVCFGLIYLKCVLYYLYLQINLIKNQTKMNSQSIPNQRLPYIDIVKTIAFILLVYSHMHIAMGKYI